ncbi:MAG: tyrosine-type recombinase/integrase, partial [Candidatus Solibacter sp.]
MKQLFGQFILARKYLKNISDATAYSYGNACQALFTLHGSDLRLGDLTKEQLSNRIITMRQHGLSAGGCNVYIRTVNAFLNWLHEEDRIKAKIKLPLLKEEQKVIQPFSVDQARRIVHWKPKCDSMRRLHVLMLLLLDTGMRIEEAFTLRKEQVNLDDLLITVNGKGKKQRIIPMSFEMRKILFRHLSGSTSILVFSTRNGLRLKHRNVLRDMKDVAKRIGIAGVRVSP